MSRTQFFGYFSIFQGVHHPKTDVLVLQDLCCQLEVHIDNVGSVFFVLQTSQSRKPEPGVCFY